MLVFLRRKEKRSLRAQQVGDRERKNGTRALGGLVLHELDGEAAERVLKAVFRILQKKLHGGLGAALHHKVCEHFLGVGFDGFRFFARDCLNGFCRACFAYRDVRPLHHGITVGGRRVFKKAVGKRIALGGGCRSIRRTSAR